MDSKAIGADVKKVLLSKISLGKSFGVDKELQQTAKNFLSLGKISHDLNVTNQNIIRLVKAFGIEAREKEDAHFLKQDQREINFKVRQDKYIDSKVKKQDSDDGGGPKGGLVRQAFRKKVTQFIRDIKAKVLKKLRHDKTFKEIYRAYNKYKKLITEFLKKIDFRKILNDWFKEKAKNLGKFLVEKGKIVLKAIGNGLKKLIPKLGGKALAKFSARAATIAAAGAGTLGIGSLIVTIGFILWDAVDGAIEEMTRTDREGNWFVGAVSGIFSGLTFGLIDTKDIADQIYIFTDWLGSLWIKIKDVLTKSFDFVNKTLTDFIEPYLKSLGKTFDMKSKQAEYDKQVDEEQIRIEKEKKAAEEAERKEAEYITNLANENRKKVELKKQLVKDIEHLNSEEEKIKKVIEYYEKINAIKQKIAGSTQQFLNEKVLPILPKRVRDAVAAPAPAAKTEKPEQPNAVPKSFGAVVNPYASQTPRPEQPSAIPKSFGNVVNPYEGQESHPAPKPPEPVPVKPKEGTPEWFAINDTNINSWVNAVYQKKEKLEAVPKVYLPYVNKRLSVLNKEVPKEAPTTPTIKQEPVPTAPAKTGEWEEGSSSKGKVADAKAWINSLWQGTVAAAKKMDVPPLALLGQWAIESSWGTKITGDYNYFGIKSFGKGPQRLVDTTEANLTKAQIQFYKDKGWFIKDLGGGKVRVKDLFKSFSSPEDAISGYVDFLTNNARYKGVFGSKTPEEFGTKLKNAGYATDTTYAEKIVSMVNSVKKRLSNDQVALIDKPDTGTKNVSKAVGGQDTDILSNAFTVVEPETGKKMIYDSKEMFLGHRQQMKPTEYDVTNITEVGNINILKFKNVPQQKEVQAANLLLNRVTC